jgi:sulfopropanediol 3-dehydrogenase
MNLKVLKNENPVPEEDIRKLQDSVRSILERVKKEGDKALRFYEKKFDNYEPDSFRITAKEAA